MKKQRRFIWNNLFSLGTNYCQLQKRKQQLLTNHSLWFSLKTRHLIVTLVNSVFLSPEDQNPGEAQPDQQDNPTVANTWKKYRSFVFHIFLSHSKFYIWSFIIFYRGHQLDHNNYIILVLILIITGNTEPGALLHPSFFLQVQYSTWML